MASSYLLLSTCSLRKRSATSKWSLCILVLYFLRKKHREYRAAAEKESTSRYTKPQSKTHLCVERVNLFQSRRLSCLNKYMSRGQFTFKLVLKINSQLMTDCSLIHTTVTSSSGPDVFEEHYLYTYTIFGCTLIFSPVLLLSKKSRSRSVHEALFSREQSSSPFFHRNTTGSKTLPWVTFTKSDSRQDSRTLAKNWFWSFPQEEDLYYLTPHFYLFI